MPLIILFSNPTVAPGNNSSYVIRLLFSQPFDEPCGTAHQYTIKDLDLTQTPDVIVVPGWSPGWARPALDRVPIRNEALPLIRQPELSPERAPAQSAG